jgi:hypothetical protein
LPEKSAVNFAILFATSAQAFLPASSSKLSIVNRAVAGVGGALFG